MPDEENDTTAEEKGQKLLTAVERLLADNGALAKVVAEARDSVPRGERTEADWTHLVAGELISRYSNRSALSGGAAALPAVIPGVGSLVTLLGGTLADMAMMLKFEVELVLCLSSLYGYDIELEKERQVAFLLAGVNTYEAKADRNIVLDVVAAEGTAIWNYTPRQLSKAVVSIFTKIALLALSKSFFRVIPVVGVAVGAGMNKTLTTRVGRRSEQEIVRRRAFEGAPG